jgi:chromosome segregation ATPase
MVVVKQRTEELHKQLRHVRDKNIKLEAKCKQQNATLKIWQEGLSRIPSLEAEILAARRVMHTELHNQQVRLGKEKQSTDQEAATLEKVQTIVSNQKDELKDLQCQILEYQSKLKRQNQKEARTSSMKPQLTAVGRLKMIRKEVVGAKNTLRLAQQDLRRLRSVCTKSVI